ncbi:lactoylglutathione lyase / glyoxalase I family protein [Striga asiatica]|uniref:Lactoylglutathione lyase / glyoxalase I family protein n=1 Tax=Striga asiatica TaxID=4170 RepID=A0A5A7Q4N7_STRAF|nr:lactoylglutathione lyase / glyoxalase I family protein [Striga asiatica]
MGKEINIEKIGQVLGKSSPIWNNKNINGLGRRELPLLSLNHVSFICKSVRKSVEFYEQVLGFVLIQRPSSFDFEGAWLFNHGIGIHLLQSDNANMVSKAGKKINPKDNHISFECSDMGVIMSQLEEMNVEYVKGVVREGGIIVDQIFFHDPDGYMIEICNCHNLPLLPISSCPLPRPKSNIAFHGKNLCSGEAEALMLENLAMDMFNLSI